MIDLSNTVSVDRVTPDDGQYFFGYYDISPESPDGKRILVNKAPFIDRMPGQSDELEIGYIDADTGSYNRIGATTAWTFQEGCRLQWIDDNRVIYNDRNDDGTGVHAVAYDLNTNDRIDFAVPIATISSKRQIAICHSFINNKYCYSFEGKKCYEIDTDGGLYLLELTSGDLRCLISKKKLDEELGVSGEESWIEHCVLNPSGSSFFFLHRFSADNGVLFSSLCYSDLNGSFRILLKKTFVSHCSWRNDDAISAWCRIPSAVNSIQKGGFLRRNKKLYSFLINTYHRLVKSNSIRNKIANDSYVLFDVSQGNYKKIINADLISDGHDTWNDSGRYMLTDTYPDNREERSLLVYDYSNDETYLLGKFLSLPSNKDELIDKWNYSGMRCDLHPKQTFQKKNVYFDSVHEGYRGLYRIRISDYVEEWCGNN